MAADRGWLVGAFVGAMVCVVRSDARPLWRSLCNTDSKVLLNLIAYQTCQPVYHLRSWEGAGGA